MRAPENTSMSDNKIPPAFARGALFINNLVVQLSPNPYYQDFFRT